MHYSGTNSRVSLPQRYQRGQPNEKNIPTYTLSRTSRFSISSSTTSQYPLRPRIVSGTTYGSDYNPSNTTYSIISMTDVDYVSSWRESISTNTGSLNRISIIQDIHDEVYYLLKGTRDTPISKRAIRKHFSAQYGSSLVEIYGDFINECVSEFYQDNTNRHLSSTSSAFSVKQSNISLINNNTQTSTNINGNTNSNINCNTNSSSNSRIYGITNNSNNNYTPPYQSSLLNNISLSQPLSQSQSLSRNSVASSYTESKKRISSSLIFIENGNYSLKKF